MPKISLERLSIITGHEYADVDMLTIPLDYIIMIQQIYQGHQNLLGNPCQTKHETRIYQDH